MHMMRRAAISLGISIAVVLSASAAHAQTYYVRSGAGGNGSDWTNAYPSLPQSLVRGATYYLAAGSYTGYTFDDAPAGSTLITIKKATAADHGTSTGWLASYANQAIFTGTLDFRTSYFIIDGQTRNSDWRSGYGLKIQAGGNHAVKLGIPFQTSVSDITLRYVEIQGSGDRSDTYNDRGIASALGSSNLTVSHSYIHDQGECNLHLLRNTNVTIEYTWIARNHSSPAVHAEGIAAPEGTSNFVFRYNVMEDIEGTAYIATPTGDHPACNGTLQRDWYIYGNVFMRRPTSSMATGNGVVYVFDHRHTGDFLFYNNSIINVENGFVGFESLAASAGCGDSMRVQNNLWFNARYSMTPTQKVTDLTWSHNAYFATSTTDSDPNRQVGSQTPFANWTAYDFGLAFATTRGVSLPTPYNLDWFGSVRGVDGSWDRGALELGGSPIPAPAAPTSLRIVIQ
jgi:hypothetical protein